MYQRYLWRRDAVKKRLRTYGITPDRVDEIVAARQADEARDWSVVCELSHNEPVNVHDFCQWLFHNVESQRWRYAGAIAYGHWDPNDRTIRNPPRAGAVYFMLSIIFGDGNSVDGKYDVDSKYFETRMPHVHKTNRKGRPRVYASVSLSTCFGVNRVLVNGRSCKPRRDDVRTHDR